MSLEALFFHQLKNIYNAETQIIEVLPSTKEKASDPELKNALAEHLEVTNDQKHRLEELGKELGVDLEGETCKGMEGLVQEVLYFHGDKVVEELKSSLTDEVIDNVRDAGITATIQRIEHYEISAYGTAEQIAKTLGHPEIARILRQIKEQEIAADEKLNKLAVNNHINEKAMGGI